MAPPKVFDFSGEVAIVSSSGSRMAGGIGNGRDTAIMLARHGAKVALVGLNKEWAQETKRMIDKEGGISEVIEADVTVDGSCKNAVSKTVELFGTLMCAQVGVGGAMGYATQVDLIARERDFRINVTSMMSMVRHTVPEMRKKGCGAIVNIFSTSGLLGGNPSPLYPTTKGAIIQMTRAMAAQHGPKNIRVNCVAPGMVFTPMVRGRGMTEEMRQARINESLLKQERMTWDVRHAILFYCSKESKRISGLTVSVDGGIS
ncbi:hypothetical protein F4775DRAFT_583626 [Biscogniauxia sp. FL1348]|nr:hypothetical protein F4775DRAFT_583626 [Biscogniauxia sp. FL1348]